MKKLTKIVLLVLISAVICISAVACGESNVSVDVENLDNASDATETAAKEVEEEDGVYIEASDNFTKFDTRISYDESSAIFVTLKDGATEINGSGATADGDVITISLPGTYVFSGSLSNGQIIVSVEKVEKVQLVFNGVSVTSSVNSPLIISSADKVAITLCEGTTNTLTDASTYVNLDEKGEPTGCIFSKDDLTINGNGTLTVTGNYNNGIVCRNDLKIVSGNVTVTAKNNAIKAKDSFLVNSGNLTVVSDDDGIKVNEDEDAEKGFILIEGGTIKIEATDDGLTAITSVKITAGTVTTICGGKSINCSGTVDVATGCLIEK